MTSLAVGCEKYGGMDWGGIGMKKELLV